MMYFLLGWMFLGFFLGIVFVDEYPNKSWSHGQYMFVTFIFGPVFWVVALAVLIFSLTSPIAKDFWDRLGKINFNTKNKTK